MIRFSLIRSSVLAITLFLFGLLWVTSRTVIPNLGLNLLDSKVDEIQFRIEQKLRLDDTAYSAGIVPYLQPFLPRLALFMYLSTLNGTGDDSFNWYYWVDMKVVSNLLLDPSLEKPSCLLLFGGPQNDLDSYCVDDTSSPLGCKIVTNPKVATGAETLILIGKSFLLSSPQRPVPRAIIFNDGQSLHRLRIGRDEESVPDERQRAPPLDPGSDLLEFWQAHNKVYGIPIDPLSELGLLSGSPNVETITGPKFATNILEESLFQFDPEEAAACSFEEASYCESLLHSAKLVGDGEANSYTIDKYFAETIAIDSTGNRLGNHYDWRFFNGIKSQDEIQKILSRLLRDWLQFTDQVGLRTWIAHGTLLSWYWSGMNFPWEDDVDVQMPIQSLHQLARKYNQTIYVGNLAEGGWHGRYFIDVTSSITLRERLDGSNNIDARFIDIESGLFIDITGVAISKMPAPSRYLTNLPADFRFINDQGEEAKLESYQRGNELLNLYSCRNGHFSSLSELSPLIPVQVEGEAAYVPNSFKAALISEYGESSVTEVRFNGHFYILKLRIWVKEQDICTFLQDRALWVEKEGNTVDENCTLSSEQVSQVLSISDEDLVKLMAKREIFYAYYFTREFTGKHMRLMEKIRRR